MKSTLYLYSKYAFFAAKATRAILLACAILLALVEHIKRQNRGLLMIFLKIISPQPHLKKDIEVGALETSHYPILKLAKICWRG